MLRIALGGSGVILAVFAGLDLVLMRILEFAPLGIPSWIAGIGWITVTMMVVATVALVHRSRWSRRVLVIAGISALILPLPMATIAAVLLFIAAAFTHPLAQPLPGPLHPPAAPVPPTSALT